MLVRRKRLTEKCPTGREDFQRQKRGDFSDLKFQMLFCSRSYNAQQQLKCCLLTSCDVSIMGICVIFYAIMTPINVTVEAFHNEEKRRFVEKHLLNHLEICNNAKGTRFCRFPNGMFSWMDKLPYAWEKRARFSTETYKYGKYSVGCDILAYQCGSWYEKSVESRKGIKKLNSEIACLILVCRRYMFFSFQY